MDPELFEAAPGRLERNEAGELFYVPPAIPRSLDYQEEVVNQLSTANRELGRLSSFSDIIPNPHLLIRPLVVREAVLSSRIEGTRASVTDVFREEAGGQPETQRGDVGEVMNYVRALEHGRARLGERPIGIELIKELHEILLEGVRGEEKNPGEFRDTAVWLGPAGVSRDGARYVPPEPGFVAGRMADLQEFLDDPPEMPPLVRIALMHYQFEATHPFRDGNGRIGRLLVTLRLIERGILPEPLMYLSEYFNTHRNEYYDRLEGLDRRGEYTAWLAFFLEGVIQQARDAAQRSQALVQLRKSYRNQLYEMDATKPAIRLVDRLFSNPFISIPQARDYLDVSYPTAQKAVEEYLVEAGVLEEITGKQRYREFLAQDVLDAVEGDT